jgi:uncharacterized protein (DUF885 family)
MAPSHRPVSSRATCLAALLAGLVLGGCAATPPAVAPAPAAAVTPAAKQALDALFAEYWEDALERSPVLATRIGDLRYNDRYPIGIDRAEINADRLADERWLAKAQALDAAQLGEADRLNLDMFIYGRKRAIRVAGFPGELMPLNQFQAEPLGWPQLGTGSGAQPFRTVKEYEDWLARSANFTRWVDVAIANSREGIRRGLVLPKPLVERLVPLLEGLASADLDKSLFMRPVQQFPAGVPEADRARLVAAYRQQVEQVFNPAYTRLAAFLKAEYLPAARTTIAWGDLPGGAEWYADLVQRQTTTSYTPAEIHALGLAEVARIGREIDGVIAQVGFQTSEPNKRKAFFEWMRKEPRFQYADEPALLRHYNGLKGGVNAALPRVFKAFPKSDFEIRPVEPFRAASAAGGQYSAAAPDGSRPGIFYVNTYDLKSRPSYAAESLYLHEAMPGHHFQVALAQEQESLPAFRRFGGGITAYSEGWALYAESLGRDLGLYTDPYQYAGALSSEMFRAVRLVVDTGMHSKGWSREQAVQFMLDNTASGETAARTEIDRYLAIPGQALSYKMGELKIKALRARAEQALGQKFDLREFHWQVLKDGALPLEVLDAKIQRWIDSQR